MDDHSQWVTEGWFSVSPNGASDTGITAFGNTILFYAKNAAGVTWSGTGRPNELTAQALVDNTKAFTVREATPADLQNAETVAFFGRAVTGTGTYEQEFSCP
jgi:hypothetical protein